MRQCWGEPRAGAAFVPAHKSSCLHVLKSIKPRQPQVQTPARRGRATFRAR